MKKPKVTNASVQPELSTDSVISSLNHAFKGERFNRAGQYIEISVTAGTGHADILRLDSNCRAINSGSAQIRSVPGMR